MFYQKFVSKHKQLNKPLDLICTLFVRHPSHIVFTLLERLRLSDTNLLISDGVLPDLLYIY